MALKYDVVHELVEDLVHRNPFVLALTGLGRRVYWNSPFAKRVGDGAHAILEDRTTGKILCVQPRTEQLVSFFLQLGRTRFHLPGGGIKAGESQMEAMRRELFEEVGLTIDLSEAKRWQEVVPIGRRRLPNLVTFFHLLVDMNELNLSGYNHVELVAEPIWIRPEMAARSGTESLTSRHLDSEQLIVSV